MSNISNPNTSISKEKLLRKPPQLGDLLIKKQKTEQPANTIIDEKNINSDFFLKMKETLFKKNNPNLFKLQQNKDIFSQKNDEPDFMQDISKQDLVKKMNKEGKKWVVIDKFLFSLENGQFVHVPDCDNSAPPMKKNPANIGKVLGDRTGNFTASLNPTITYDYYPNPIEILGNFDINSSIKTQYEGSFGKTDLEKKGKFTCFKVGEPNRYIFLQPNIKACASTALAMVLSDLGIPIEDTFSIAKDRVNDTYIHQQLKQYPSLKSTEILKGKDETPLDFLTRMKSKMDELKVSAIYNTSGHYIVIDHIKLGETLESTEVTIREPLSGRYLKVSAKDLNSEGNKDWTELTGCPHQTLFIEKPQ